MAAIENGSFSDYSIIIDKITPTFTKQLPAVIANKGKEILRGLNLVQRDAALKAITANDYLLLRGLPGMT